MNRTAWSLFECFKKFMLLKMSDLDEILVNLFIHKHFRIKRSSTYVQTCWEQYHLMLHLWLRSQEHRVLYRCNYPTAVINYGWKLCVLSSRQESLNMRSFIFTWMPFQTISFTKTKKICRLETVTYKSICSFII